MQFVVGRHVSLFCDATRDSALKNNLPRFACRPYEFKHLPFLFYPLSSSSAYRVLLRGLRTCLFLICHMQCYCQFQRVCRFMVEDVQVRCMQCKGGSCVWRPGICCLCRPRRLMLPHSLFFGREFLQGRSVFNCISVLSDRWRLIDFVLGKGRGMLNLRLL